ncbi:MAG TPA: FMN-binding glutamate synthase family protein [Gammaproteobacteria bacterium]|nr:FMN-binding glutamate synthase family protein [Gammaproteobacteria bacterium]
MRYFAFGLMVFLTVAFGALGFFLGAAWWWGLALPLPLTLVGIYDLLQREHNVVRSYPILAHIRFMAEAVRPQIRQYFVESDTDGKPFDHNERKIIHQRARGIADAKPFGTQLDVYGDEYEWINHSIAARTDPDADAMPRVDIGGPQCERPYSASIFNISAMSFGALGSHAIMALNKGARLGNFAHDTGEGGLSPYHQRHGGDLIWEIGSGYFGCRNDDGTFNADMFRDTAQSDQVKMVELKLSQGAKPGHGGLLPAAKVTPEIAATRRVPVHRDCLSPSSHSAFSTPIGLLEFVARMRDLSGGKPAGFKLCIGHRWEFLAICKAMRETGILPDFIVIDGAEGGTGAAPLELSDGLGTPLREGLLFAHNALVGAGLRDHIRIGASGKAVTGFKIAVNLALGADWCNSARGFMFSLGCIQSQKCHTGRCPTGITTMDPNRQRSLIVEDKAQHVHRFHRHTVQAVGMVAAAAGLEHPAELRPNHVSLRISSDEIRTAAEFYDFLEPGELLDGTDRPAYRRYWDMARADSFAPAGIEEKDLVLSA